MVRSMHFGLNFPLPTHSGHHRKCTSRMDMEHIEVSKIEILGSGELSVTPSVNWNNMFQSIYRAASGVAWNEATNSFVTPKPKEWSYIDWYENLVASVVSEMGINLKIAPNTEWINVPNNVQKKILACLPSYE